MTCFLDSAVVVDERKGEISMRGTGKPFLGEPMIKKYSSTLCLNVESSRSLDVIIKCAKSLSAHWWGK